MLCVRFNRGLTEDDESLLSSERLDVIDSEIGIGAEISMFLSFSLSIVGLIFITGGSSFFKYDLILFNVVD